jgi:hypothetical protein
LFLAEFWFASEFDASALRGVDAGAGPSADKAAFKLGEKPNHLPHGAACRRLGVDVLGKRTEFNPTGAEVIEHGYEIA